MNRLKDTLQTHLTASDLAEEETTGESILKMADKLTLDLTEADLEPLPSDAAEAHDYYLYGTGKPGQ